jgi:hypothetical protein
MPSTNVLIIAFDDVDGKAIVPKVASPAGATDSGATPPGLAQAGAAALRRALVRGGWSDVLTTAPDSPVLRRALKEGRITSAALDSLRTSFGQLAALSVQDSAAVPVSAASSPSPLGASPLEPSPLTPVPATDDTRTAAVQALSQAASRIGQALGYRAVLVLAVVPQNVSNAGARREATYVLSLVDSLRQVAAPLSFDEAVRTPFRCTRRRLWRLRHSPAKSCMHGLRLVPASAHR